MKGQAEGLRYRPVGTEVLRMLAGVYQLWSRKIILTTICKVRFKKQLEKKKIRAARVGRDGKQQKLTRRNSLEMEGVINLWKDI